MATKLPPFTATAVIRNVIITNPDPSKPAIQIDAKWEEKP
jgi:hypothetical protein